MKRSRPRSPPQKVIPLFPAPRRSRASEAEDARDALLLGANVLAGVFDFFSGLEQGEETLPAARKAVKRTKTRAKAIRNASREPDEEPEDPSA